MIRQPVNRNSPHIAQEAMAFVLAGGRGSRLLELTGHVLQPFHTLPCR